MRKIALALAAAICVSALVGCGGADTSPDDTTAAATTTETTVATTEMIDVPPTADSVNEAIAAFSGVTDKASAEEVSRILGDYAELDAEARAAVTGIENIRSAVADAVTYFDEEEMSLKVMSFNVYYKELTPERMGRVIETIRQNSPDVVGLQEGTPEMCAAINEALGDEYEMLGMGRDGNAESENCNVLYKKDAFTLLDSATMWLSTTPEDFSFYQGATQPRIMTYQLLQRKSDGQIFLHVNTHFDLAGTAVRTAEATIMTDIIAEKFEGKYPVVITGDFNTVEDRREFRTILDAGYSVTNTYGDKESPTYQGFGEKDAKVIDFCFVNELLPVTSYYVCDEKIDGEWVSDHNAIVSEMYLIPAVG